MPLQNRVTPFGNILADENRGLFTGNRGVLHDPGTKTLHPIRRWAAKAWIICICDFNGRARPVFGANGPNGSPGWTNLFFLDEATALAAGHRPCFHCQRERAMQFQSSFSDGQGVGKMKMPEIDAILHRERLSKREKRIHPIPQRLPNGAMVADDASAYLHMNGEYYKWSFEGYELAQAVPANLVLLTPPSSVQSLAFGYQPILHSSVQG